jgi:transcriptional regulator with XRE-family HTH domain
MSLGRQAISPKKPQPQSFDSVAEMLATLGDPEGAQQLSQAMQARVILDLLVHERLRQNKSQKEMADLMGCTQGRISKLENGTDESISVGDAQQYARKLNCEIQFGMRKVDESPADEIRFLSSGIKQRLQGFLKSGVNFETTELIVENLTAAIEHFEKLLASSIQKLQKSDKNPLQKVATQIFETVQ